MAGEKTLSAPVVFADRVFMSEESLAEISSLGGYAWAEARDNLDLAEKIGGSPSVQVIVSEYVLVDGPVLDQAPGLKGVIAYGAGYDHIGVGPLKEKGVKVCNCRGENAQAVAELAVGLLLSLLRKIHRADPWVRGGEWEKAGRSLPDWATGGELWRKTLGVVGLGQIGSRVARIAKGFDMKIIGYDPFIDPSSYSSLGVEPQPLEALFSRADIISLHLPFNPNTERLIDARILSAMKPHAVLVNTSRGKVVDEGALVDLLKERRIRGAALDVFSSEPISSSHPLSGMDNVLLSPHIGAMSREAGERLSAAVARQVRDILAGRRPECLID